MKSSLGTVFWEKGKMARWQDGIQEMWILYLTLERIPRRKGGTAFYDYTSSSGNLVQLHESLNEQMGPGLVCNCEIGKFVALARNGRSRQKLSPKECCSKGQPHI
jgi:hypothetical protein